MTPDRYTTLPPDRSPDRLAWRDHAMWRVLCAAGLAVIAAESQRAAETLLREPLNLPTARSRA